MGKPGLKIHDHRTHIQRKKSNKIRVILDSTGINIYHTTGSHSKENSSSRQLHGRQQTRKLHIVLDIESRNILGMEMTSGVAHDSMPVPKLLGDIKQTIVEVYADAAYDAKKVRVACRKHQAKQ